MILKRRRAAFVFVFITIVLDVLALGIIIPVLPRLTIELVGGDEATAGRMIALFGASWAIMQLLAMPVLGALSDTFGRRPVIILSNLGLGLDYVLLALAPTIWWLYAGRLINGITSASMSTAYAYIADVTPPEKRAQSYGLLGAAFGIGFVFGPTIGGILGGIDLRLPFWAAAGLGVTNALFGYFVLPESLAPENRAPFRLKGANPIGALNFLRAKAGLAGLATITFLSNFAHYVLPSTFALYAYYRFGWSEEMMGLTLAAVGVGSLIVQGALIGPAIKRFGERNCLVFGLACGGASFAVYGLAETSLIMWLGIPLASLWGLAGPANQGLMSRIVSPTEQGQLQGALGSVMAIGGLIGPAVFPLVFAAAIAKGAPVYLPGAPFLVSAAAMFLAAMIAPAIVARLPSKAEAGSKAA